MRVVIPKEERKNVLSQLHASHQGLEKSKRRARESVFWPGINSDIANTVNACNSCQELRPSNKKEEMKIEEPPERIFQKVSADFFSVAGRDFLVIVDRLSNWPVIFNYEKGQTKTRSLIHSFRKYFADVGIPEVLRTDGGPQFASREFRVFLEKFGVTHEMSTPYYAQSNGHAESAVKNMKHLIIKTTKKGCLNNDEFYAGLLEFRNTPNNTGLSPASIVFGHNLRSLVPAHRKYFDKKWTEIIKKLDKKLLNDKSKAALNYDRTAKPSSPINIGVSVRIQNPKEKVWDAVGEVVGKGRNRDYLVKLPSGKIIWRNRKFLKPSMETHLED